MCMCVCACVVERILILVDRITESFSLTYLLGGHWNYVDRESLPYLPFKVLKIWCFRFDRSCTLVYEEEEENGKRDRYDRNQPLNEKQYNRRSYNIRYMSVSHFSFQLRTFLSWCNLSLG